MNRRPILRTAMGFYIDSILWPLLQSLCRIRVLCAYQKYFNSSSYGSAGLPDMMAHNYLQGRRKTRLTHWAPCLQSARTWHVPMSSGSFCSGVDGTSISHERPEISCENGPNRPAHVMYEMEAEGTSDLKRRGFSEC